VTGVTELRRNEWHTPDRVVYHELSELMATADGASSPEGDKSRSPEVDPLVVVLGWMTDRAAEALPQPDEPSPAQLSWGVDAGSFPPAYWHWLHLNRLHRLEQPDEVPIAELPTDGPLLSIVVPVYRPSLWYFEECVRSVIGQTYAGWELCLCDDGSNDPELTAAMAEFAASDPRIKALALEQNGGISRASNQALAAASGEFIVLLDHDDVLDPDALAEVAAVVIANKDVDVIYSDEDKLDELDRPFMPHFKPDWEPDLLLAYPYVGHVMVIRHELLTRIGGFRSEFDGSQDYDVMLRSTEVARRVVHIPKVLYHWRVVAGSAAGDTDAKPWAHLASRRVLEDTMVRRGVDATVEPGPFQGAYHVRRRIIGSPTVSVIIPFRDQAALTVSCLDSLERASGYDIREVVFVDNGSIEPETHELRRRLELRPNTRVIDYPGAFNWAAINNAAAATCDSDMLLFLNNDIEATSDGWLHALVELGQRPEIGAVGARLIYPDGKLQHAGVVLGLGGVASHLFIGMPKENRGYFSWDQVVRGYSAVTAACMLVRRNVFEELGGFDEAFAVGFNDVDFCLRLGRAGYRLLCTPHAELTHYESVSRGLSGFYGDYQEFLARWTEVLREGDPLYNSNLGRLDPWCPLRPPGEDEVWLKLVDGLVRVQPLEDAEDAEDAEDGEDAEMAEPRSVAEAAG
jgi:O-antigen biosynthesis protein